MKKVILFASLFSTVLLCAKVELPSIFSKHAVLARHAKVPVWGKAAPGEKVTVSFNKQTVSTVAGKDGKWRVFLDLKDSPEGPFVLQVNDKKIDDVIVGEVWLCSGQSNMAMTLRSSTGFAEEIKTGLPNKKLRMFAVKMEGKDTPQENCKGAWYIADSRMVGSFSAASYYFGKTLQKELNRPIGLIKSAQGASYIESWMDKENFNKFPAAVARAARRAKNKKPAPWYRRPNTLFNATIHPLIPYRLNGIIWYQGESNSKYPDDYADLFRGLIAQWRRDFNDPELAFYWCSLAAHHDKSADAGEFTAWGMIRQKQTEVLNVPHTGQAILTDAGEAKDVHPRNKKVAGERLAALALARSYGRNIPCTGPAAVKAEKEGSAVVISFKDIYDGLEARPVPATQIIKSKENKTAPLVRNSPSALLEGFALCGKDNKWYWADKADIRGGQVVLSSQNVKEPVKVRCSTQDNPTCNLYNKAGFPVVPFELNVR